MAEGIIEVNLENPNLNEEKDQIQTLLLSEIHIQIDLHDFLNLELIILAFQKCGCEIFEQAKAECAGSLKLEKFEQAMN
jgi:hypothetical protein